MGECDYLRESSQFGMKLRFVFVDIQTCPG